MPAVIVLSQDNYLLMVTWPENCHNIWRFDMKMTVNSYSNLSLELGHFDRIGLDDFNENFPSL